MGAEPTIGLAPMTCALTAPLPSEEVALPVDDSWKLRMSPERYLQLHPDGKHADQARELLEAQKEPEESQSDA